MSEIDYEKLAEIGKYFFIILQMASVYSCR